MKSIVNSPQVVVVGLGYVNLPVAIALARPFPVTGYDLDSSRIAALGAGNTRTKSVEMPL